MIRASCDVRLLSGLLMTLSAVVAGCNGPSGPARYEVSGTVKIDGKPVKAAVVTLVPKEGTKGPGAGGEIIDGQFHIPKAKGPIAGEYIFQFDGSSDVSTGQFKEMKGVAGKVELMLPLFPQKYNQLSNESRKIGPDSTKFEFDLSRK